MQRKQTVLLTVFLLVALLIPQRALARTVSVFGSLTVTGAASTDLVGLAVIHNPGFEKTITQHIPPFTVQVLLDVDKDDATGQVVTRRGDTAVALTNVSGGTLGLTLTVRDANGTTVATSSISLDSLHTIVKDISELLP